MDGTMRDLNLIREQADEQDATTQRWALYGLAGGVTVLLVLALCFQLGPTAPASEVDADPLARLDAIGRTQRGDEGVVESSLAAPSVDRVALSFPEQLTEDPPDIAAALAAAAAEAAHPDSLGLDEGAAAVPVAPATPSMEHLPEMLPAAVAATEGSDIARVAMHDELVQSAFPTARVTDPAREGHDGEFTLQVISYDSADGAQAFAQGLRARGHRAFVMQATVEGRGTMYRVRIGPFETMGEASAYRGRFEASEHMNTIVIRRREAS
jgi:cell division septation protein DedD